MGSKGAGHKAYLTRLRNQRSRKGSRKKGQVVGFYKEHGKTKPITKSMAQLKQKKMVKSGKQFKGVAPKVREQLLNQAAQNFWDTVGAKLDFTPKLNAGQVWADWVMNTSSGKKFLRTKEAYLAGLIKFDRSIKPAYRRYNKQFISKLDHEIDVTAAESFFDEANHGNTLWR
jgi:hypothetical protein